MRSSSGARANNKTIQQKNIPLVCFYFQIIIKKHLAFTVHSQRKIEQFI